MKRYVRPLINQTFLANPPLTIAPPVGVFDLCTCGEIPTWAQSAAVVSLGKMKPGWPTGKEAARHMREMKKKNLGNCVRAEIWAARLLPKGLTRQACWGFKIMDFWCAERGVRIEIDGQSHDPLQDYYIDEWFFRRSGILTLRVPNYDLGSLSAARFVLLREATWKARKELVRELDMCGRLALPSMLGCYLNSRFSYDYWSRGLKKKGCDISVWKRICGNTR